MFSSLGMFEGCMKVSIQMLHLPLVFAGNENKSRVHVRTRSNPSASAQHTSLLPQTDKSQKLLESKNISSSLLSQTNTVGIMGGVSVFTTLIFLEKLVWWSSRDGEDLIPFVVCSDPNLYRDLLLQGSFHCFNKRNVELLVNHVPIVENLRRKRAFLEHSGAGCIVMPCHVSHAWHDEISEGCSLPFFHVGECVARELKKANMKPLEAGSNVRIGVLTFDTALMASFYKEKLQSQGFEVVLPDKATMEHIVIPAMEAMKNKDMEGARNLLRIAIQVLLVRAVNKVLLASDEMQGLLPCNDPLLNKCIDPMDALARSTIKWAKSTSEN